MDKASLKHLCKLKPRPSDPNPSAHKPRMIYTNQKSAHVILSFLREKGKKTVNLAKFTKRAPAHDAYCLITQA